ncbi:hypothetical protein ACVBIO_19440 [Shewanella sp. 0m-8]
MKVIAYAILSAALVAPSISYANDSQNQIEHITVTYRTPFEYAMYQYTSDMLQDFNQQVRVEIQQQAKSNIMQMAKEQGFISSQVAKAEQPNKTVLNSGVLKSAE